MAPTAVPSANADISLFHPQVILGTVVLTGGILSGYSFYKSNLRRIPTSIKVPQRVYRKRFLYGRVTSVGDGDNFHFYHLPGGRVMGWGWLRPYPKTNDFRANKNQTIAVRLCGVDAPERSHFGKPAQPYSEEALQWLRDYVLGKNVWVKPLSLDQYQRIVGKVVVWKLFRGYKDVSAEMIANGVGVVYENTNAGEFDGGLVKYKRLETMAKNKRRGLWSDGVKKLVTPGEYKKMYK